jgi:hypothetical protein
MTGSVHLRASQSDAVLPDLAAGWRRLFEGRPHRMGGYHDGVQSDAKDGPTDHLLLFQIASDEVMHWYRHGAYNRPVG